MNFFDRLKSILESSDLQKWKLSLVNSERKEFYFINKTNAVSVDQSRSVNEQSYYVSLAVSKSNRRIGSASAPVSKYKDPKVAINELIEKAKLSDEQGWSYLEPQENKHEIQSTYPGFQRDFELGAQIIADKMRLAIVSQKEATFNSAELFIAKINERNAFSNGLDHSFDRSKIYAEMCFSSDSSLDAQEYLLYKMAAHPEQLNFNAMAEESIRYAKALKSAQTPEAGKYSVMVDAEVFGQLLYDSLSHLSLSQKYYRLPFREKLSSYIDDYNGESFQLLLDPFRDFLFGSRLYNAQGAVTKACTLVDNNKILENISTPQMSQYLNLPNGPSKANLIVKAQGSDIQSWHKDKPVLEILQFSGLFSNPRDLSFSSEIRLGRVWQPGESQPKYIKGGSLSGKVQDNFKSLKFANNYTRINLNEESLGYSVGYEGPNKVLLNDVSISS